MKSYTTGCELGDRAEQPVEEKLEDEDEVEGDGDDAIPVHPLGVKPSGNALAADGDIRPAMGVFGLLPDELVLTVLESFDASTLRRLGMTCRALYAFTRAEELWKALFIQ